MKEIKDILNGMHPWARIEKGDDELTKDIVADLNKICQYPVQEIRNAIQSFVDDCQKSDEGYTTDQMSKLYVLNRYLFELPVFEDLNEPRFAAIRGIPVENHSLNVLWPLEIGKNGELELSGIFKGYYGESYQAIKEFDHFKNKYGVRRGLMHAK